MDSCGELWLIEVNTNPCLELSSPLLEQIIPRMIDDAMKLTVDLAFEPISVEPLITKKVIELPEENLWDKI